MEESKDETGESGAKAEQSRLIGAPAVPAGPPPQPSPTTDSTSTTPAVASRTTTPTQQMSRLEVVESNHSMDLPDLPRTPRDDSSRYQFMSEPSVSEDGSDRIMAPHRLPAGPNAFRRIDPDHEGNRRGPFGSVPNSPGNTSLSSWDTSPGRTVQLHFSSSIKTGPVLPPVMIENRNGERPRLRVQPVLPRRRSVSSESPPPRDGNEEDEEDGSSGHPPSLPSIVRKVNNNNDDDDEYEESNNFAQRNTDKLTVSSGPEAPSINMALSDSEEDGGGEWGTTCRTIAKGDDDNNNCDDSEILLDWETQQNHSADDERTHPQSTPIPQLPHLPPARRGARPYIHRRTRSGDAAAASLATGGNHWKGMTKDRIPIPEAADDETDDSVSPPRSAGSKSGKKTKNGGDRQTSLENFENHLQRLFSQGNVEWHPSEHLVDNNKSPAHEKNGERRSSSDQNLQRPAHEKNGERRSLSDQNLQRRFTRPYNERQRSWEQSKGQASEQHSQELKAQRQSSPEEMEKRAADSQQNLERLAFEQNLQKQFSQPSIHYQQQHRSPSQQEMERYFFEQNSQRQFSQKSGREPSPPYQIGRPSPHGSLERRSFNQQSLDTELFHHYSENGDPALPSLFENMTPPSTSYLAQMSAGSPGMSGSPQFFQQRMDHQMQGNGMGNPTQQTNPWHHSNPSPYGEQQARSSYSSHGAAFPIVEDVDEDASSEYSGDKRPRSVEENRLKIDTSFSTRSLEELEYQLENRDFSGPYQRASQPTIISESPFANLGKKSNEKVLRSDFRPSVLTEDELNKYPTYTCPRCKTRQREFFTVSDAPRALAEPSNYLAFYFGVYVIASLFIFGLEEGWKPLDCVYFAVITLTTAGLGDYVPTTDANKIICSIFIYFGVACIGLLLGSYIASMLDDRAFRDAKRKQIDSCPNCARLQNIKDRAEAFATAGKRPMSTNSAMSGISAPVHLSMRNINAPEVHNAVYMPRRHHSREDSHSSRRTNSSGTEQTFGSLGMNEVIDHSQGNASPVFPPPPTYTPTYSPSFGSPMTRKILGRQKHTRHMSMDISNVAWDPRTRKYSEDLPAAHTPPTINECEPLNPPLSAPNPVAQVPFQSQGQGTHSLRGSVFVNDDHYNSETDDEDEYYSDESSETAMTIDEIVDEKSSKIKAAKYVFLTLKQALVNSMVIIAVGCVGFVLTEEFNVVDSWYFVSMPCPHSRLFSSFSHTTVLLTTVGYGDIVPITNGGKLFATVYILVAGTVLINNMSMISMIPLELRRRRIERAVLTQFGDQLDDEALRELATGPLIQRLSLSAERADGLDECTREMFSLAMLVRLGKVTEDDIRETFAVFRRLDVNDEGVLNSKSIIAGMIQKRRTMLQRSNTDALSIADKNPDSKGHLLPYWEMPAVPLLTTPSMGYIEPLDAMPEHDQILNPAPDQYIAPSEQYGDNFPNESTGLLQPTHDR
eukprot:scaffold5533_cov159-Amphora_coffeaeformis.AAC.10